MTFVRTILLPITALVLLSACGKPAPDSKAARDAARRIADEKVVGCMEAKTGKPDGMSFVTNSRYENAWEFEYEGGGRMCDVWIGDDGTVKVDEMHP